MKWDVSGESVDQLPAIHPAYVRVLCQGLRADGVDVDRVLARAGLSQQALQSSESHLSFERLRWFILAVARSTARPALALQAGAEIHLGAHGALGLALASSASVRTAIDLMVRFLPTRIAVWQLSTHPTPEGLLLLVQPRFDLDEAFGFLMDLAAGVISAMLKVVAPVALDRVEIRLPGPPLPWSRAYEALCGTVTFHAAQLAFHIPAELLELPCPCASASEFAMAVDECTRAAQRLAGASTVAARVRRILRDSFQAAHDLEGVAAHLGLSTRTVERRLHDEGTSFQAVLQDHRRLSALWQLRHSTRSITEIASSLGYSDPSNFSRVFRSWLGCTPTDLRQGLVPWPDDGDPTGRPTPGP